MVSGIERDDRCLIAKGTIATTAKRYPKYSCPRFGNYNDLTLFITFD